MKILSIRQPWAHLIVHGVKRIENRSRRFHYRGPLLIHASLTDAGSSREAIEALARRPLPDDLPRGGVVGVVELVDCVETHDDRFFDGPFGLVLANARPLPFIPLRGMLGLFDPPAHVLRRIEENL